MFTVFKYLYRSTTHRPQRGAALFGLGGAGWGGGGGGGGVKLENLLNKKKSNQLRKQRNKGRGQWG